MRILAITVLALCLIGSDFANSDDSGEKKKEKVQIPINIGVGPSFHQLWSPIQDRQQTIYGIDLDLYAVIDREMVDKYKERIPEKYREAALALNETKIGFLYIPTTIFITPLYNQTEVYGASWQLLEPSLGQKFGPVGISIGAPIRITYLYIHDFKRPQTTHFFRPGIGLELITEIKFSKSFLLSFTAGQTWYWPQTVHDDRTLWRIDSLNAMVHLRFPFEAEL